MFNKYVYDNILATIQKHMKFIMPAVFCSEHSKLHHIHAEYYVGVPAIICM